MKTITIGDLHGKDIWKNVNIEDYDKVIYIGDYTDAYDLADGTILRNLKDIIEQKKQNPDKVIMLLGNHDVQYMFAKEKTAYLHNCSGRRHSMRDDLHKLFNDNKDLFQLAHYEAGNGGQMYLWTHAGVVEDWYVGRFLEVTYTKDYDWLNFGQQLNLAFSNYEHCIFDCGYIRGGRYPTGGPLWADVSEVMVRPLPNINQIIGHSKVKEIHTNEFRDKNASVTAVDVFDTEPDFYELTID
jgi:hypothetical protein